MGHAVWHVEIMTSCNVVWAFLCGLFPFKGDHFSSRYLSVHFDFSITTDQTTPIATSYRPKPTLALPFSFSGGSLHTIASHVSTSWLRVRMTKVVRLLLRSCVRLGIMSFLVIDGGRSDIWGRLQLRLLKYYFSTWWRRSSSLGYAYRGRMPLRVSWR